MRQRNFVRQMRQKELRDIKLGNTSSKIVSFHRNLNAIHDSDRERGTSIVANLNLRHKEFKKSKNPFSKRLGHEKSIKLDDTSMLKLGQMTEEELRIKKRAKEELDNSHKKDEKVDFKHILEVFKKFFLERLKL